MATTVGTNDPYPVPPDKIMESIKSQEYWDAKYAALGARGVVWNKFGDEGGDWVVSSTREVPANLPSFAKKIVGEKNVVTQTERWRPDGAGGYSAAIEITVKNVPGSTAGTLKVTPAGDNRANWLVDFKINVKIPMAGKKLEGIMKTETADNLTKEYEFNKQWMTSH